MKKILIQLDTDPHPSPFDAIAAYDAGVDVVLGFGQVTAENLDGIELTATWTPPAVRPPSSVATTQSGSLRSAAARILESSSRLYCRPTH